MLAVQKRDRISDQDVPAPFIAIRWNDYEQTTEQLEDERSTLVAGQYGISRLG